MKKRWVGVNQKLKGRIVSEYGSQANFAAVMRLDESLVSRVVQGRRPLAPADVAAWSRALGCGPEIFEAVR